MCVYARAVNLHFKCPTEWWTDNSSWNRKQVRACRTILTFCLFIYFQPIYIVCVCDASFKTVGMIYLLFLYKVYKNYYYFFVMSHSLSFSFSCWFSRYPRQVSRSIPLALCFVCTQMSRIYKGELWIWGEFESEWKMSQRGVIAIFKFTLILASSKSNVSHPRKTLHYEIILETQCWNEIS